MGDKTLIAVMPEPNTARQCDETDLSTRGRLESRTQECGNRDVTNGSIRLEGNEREEIKGKWTGNNDIRSHLDMIRREQVIKTFSLFLKTGASLCFSGCSLFHAVRVLFGLSGAASSFFGPSSEASSCFLFFAIFTAVKMPLGDHSNSDFRKFTIKLNILEIQTQRHQIRLNPSPNRRPEAHLECSNHNLEYQTVSKYDVLISCHSQKIINRSPHFSREGGGAKKREKEEPKQRREIRVLLPLSSSSTTARTSPEPPAIIGFLPGCLKHWRKETRKRKKSSLATRLLLDHCRTSTRPPTSVGLPPRLQATPDFRPAPSDVEHSLDNRLRSFRPPLLAVNGPYDLLHRLRPEAHLEGSNHNLDYQTVSNYDVLIVKSSGSTRRIQRAQDRQNLISI
ncbi:hypothetical protein M5K25_015669 [Dendrobium thyrsiflorum]|uniref:Uncharacterized protein n=1 Tax=Dendrobium thyrsiflorum TaxID=117978 RepID=A0ABD0UYC2_DENTH